MYYIIIINNIRKILALYFPVSVERKQNVFYGLARTEFESAALRVIVDKRVG